MSNPLFARMYVRVSEAADARGALEHRRALLEGLSGRIIEIGAGHGGNFPHYPAAVREVVAVEPEPYLRQKAEEAAVQAPVPVKVVDATAEQLPAEDAEFDAAVFSLVLCSVPDQAVALEETARVLRSGGELRFYEHVAAETGGLARLQAMLDVVWPRFAGGCHLTRRTPQAVAEAGFEMTACRAFRFLPSPIAVPVAPHVLGTARKP